METISNGNENIKFLTCKFSNSKKENLYVMAANRIPTEMPIKHDQN